jgi:hypothetical protein
MSWHDKVFNYCERGTDPAFWAEPLNAVSNIAFILAAALAFHHLATRRDIDRSIDIRVLAGIVLIIGVGSFLFHTFAESWAVLADVIPITVFILAFLYVSLRTLAGAPRWLAGTLVILFFGLSQSISGLQCGGSACLNGSVGYLPSFLALGGFALYLSLKGGHPSTRWLWAGFLVYAVSLTFRTIDLAACSSLLLGGRSVGTHFLWHLLNGLLLYLLLRALMARPSRA